MWGNLLEKLTRFLAVFISDLCSKTERGRTDTFFDDLVDPIERTAADKQNVGGIHLDKLLLGMLPSTLRRNIGNGTFDDL